MCGTSEQTLNFYLVFHVFHIARGLEPICLSSPTNLWHFGGWVVWSTTCTCNVFSMATGQAQNRNQHIFIGFFAVNAFVWQPAKPRTGKPHYFFEQVYVCRNLSFGRFIFSLFGSTHVHSSPTFRSEDMDQYWKLLVRASESLRYWPYSTWLLRWVYPGRLPTFIIGSGFAWKGFSSHWITLWIHFQSRVTSMVAPTWCHGPVWGNHIAGDFKRPDFRIDTFNVIIRLRKVKQLAFFRFSSRRSTCWTTCRRTGQLPILDVCCTLHWHKHLFCLQRQRLQTISMTWTRHQVHGFSLRCCLFGIWRG